MNRYAIRAIYMFELERTWRTLLQSIASPVISTALYFVVFGSAIGSRMTEIAGVSYGAFIVGGLSAASRRSLAAGSRCPVHRRWRCWSRDGRPGAWSRP